jgi:hypothetical protein
MHAKLRSCEVLNFRVLSAQFTRTALILATTGCEKQSTHGYLDQARQFLSPRTLVRLPSL